MSFENPAFSFDQRQPPTPTRTPTSPSFTDVFRTPKLDASFYDARLTWNTSDAGAVNTDLLRTPKPPSFGSNNASQSADLDFFANAQHLLATPDFSALPVGSSFGSVSKEETSQTSQTVTQPALSLDTSVGPQSSIQTPPPTTTSASKRQGKKAQIVQSTKDTESPDGSKRKSVPILPKPASSGNLAAATAAEVSPGELGLDFSPAQFGWGPSTAPAYPQQKLFWDPEEHGSMSMDMTNVSFGNQRGGLEAFVSTHPSISNSQRTVTNEFGFGDDRTPMASFGSAMDTFDTSLNQSLDPSLLFSTSEVMNTFIGDDDAALQPYAHQLQEARREKGYSGVGKYKKRRKPSVDSPAVKAAMEQLREDAPRPVVQRSMTDTALSRATQDAIASRMPNPQGRSSPVKAVRAALKQQKRSHRTSIALTIDEHGRARAETRAGPSTEEAMDVDSETGSSYTASSVDDIGDEMVTSFSRPSGPKLGQFGKPSSHSQKSSTASFYSTSSQYEMSGGASGMASSSMQTAIQDDESEAETVLNTDDEADQAQNELRKTMQDRQQQRPTTHHMYSPQSVSTAFFPNTDFSTLSPTTIPDPELPSLYPSASPSHSEIRCVCGSALDDGQMIQCESCRKWQHMSCTGIKSHRLPSIYLCLFCTGLTSSSRGRVRDPNRKAHRPFASGSSSLARKKGQGR